MKFTEEEAEIISRINGELRWFAKKDCPCNGTDPDCRTTALKILCAHFKHNEVVFFGALAFTVFLIRVKQRVKVDEVSDHLLKLMQEDKRIWSSIYCMVHYLFSPFGDQWEEKIDLVTKAINCFRVLRYPRWSIRWIISRAIAWILQILNRRLAE